MGHHTLQGNPPIDVIWRRSARAKRLSLRMSRLDGRVTLTLPNRASDREGRAFLAEREAWLRENLSQVRQAVPVALGGHVLIAGREVPILQGQGTRAMLSDAGLMVPDAASAATKIRAFLKLRARDALAQASDDYAATLGRSYAKLSLRDTRSRWGSCSSAGVLMYSWRLIMAPPEVLHYVAAHEVAHLQEMNHSQAFWDVVTRLYGDYAPPRLWLRENGDLLHRVQFDD